MKLICKLKSKCGESFVEIIIAILIVAFGCMLVATMYTSAMNLNVKAAEKDDEFYKAVSQMEQMFDQATPSESDKTVVIKDDNKTTNVPIDIYGNDANAAYKEKE